MRRPLPLLLAVLALAATACGGGGGDETTTVTVSATDADTTAPPATTSAPPPTTVAPATSTAATTTSEAPTTFTLAEPTDLDTQAATDVQDSGVGGPDDAVAQTGVVRADDLGAGWTAEEDSSEDSGCITTPLRQPGPTREARGQQLTRGTTQVVRSIALVYADAETAAQAFTLTSDFSVVQCFVDVLKAEPPSGVDPAGVAAEPIQWPAAGDEVVAARVSIPVEQAGSRFTAASDLVLVRAGRVVMVAQFSSAPEPFPTDVAAPVMTAVANRVTAG